jgi:hypothetical protein
MKERCRKPNVEGSVDTPNRALTAAQKSSTVSLVDQRLTDGAFHRAQAAPFHVKRDAEHSSRFKAWLESSRDTQRLGSASG